MQASVNGKAINGPLGITVDHKLVDHGLGEAILAIVVSSSNKFYTIFRVKLFLLLLTLEKSGPALFKYTRF